MAEITWGSLWWRVKMLARVWYSDARRWVVARRRAKRIAERWRANVWQYESARFYDERRRKAGLGAPIVVTQRQMLDAMHDVRQQSGMSGLLSRGLLGGALGNAMQMRQAQEQRRAELDRKQMEMLNRHRAQWGDL